MQGRGKKSWVSRAAGGGVVLLLLGGGYGAWWYWSRPVVEVTEPVAGRVVEAFYATGTVEPRREHAVRAGVGGVLVELKVDKGSRVKEGDVLGVVEDPVLAFEVARARAELAEKMALAEEGTSPVLKEFDARIEGSGELLAIALREQKRMEQMVQTQSASQTDLDRSMDRVKVLRTEIESLKQQRASRGLSLKKDVDVAAAMLAAAESEAAKMTLRAPADGVILDRPTGLGTRLAVNDHLMMLADVSPGNLVMRAQVDEEDVAGVKPGQTVKMTLYAFGQRVFNGEVERVYDMADEDRRTFEVDVKVEMDGEAFSAGMTGELAFVLRTADAARSLPRKALQHGAIWGVVNGKLVRTGAVLGAVGTERIEVKSGLEELTKQDGWAGVVISAISEPREGMGVRVNKADDALIPVLKVEESLSGQAAGVK